MNEKGAYIQSVGRAIKIINLFTGPISELGITEIAERMELGKSTIYGLVNTLLTGGYLEQNPDNKKYRLGLRLFELGSIVQSRMDIREIARPYLKEISGEFGMTVHMGVYRDMAVVYIDKMDAPSTRILYSQVGKRAPMYCTGIGKVILANMPKADRELILEAQKREALTEHTITDCGKLRKELEKIRTNGYAVDDEEVEIGLRCVAVPIFDHKKRPVAAISISGAAAALPEEKMKAMAESLGNTAMEISGRLGFAGRGK